jgi:hypothetical protein
MQTFFNRLGIAALALILVVALLVSLFVLNLWLRADPGTDQSLNGKALDELVQELGKPQSEGYVALADIRTKNSGKAYLALPGRGNSDESARILEAKWLRSGGDLPTAMETTVWFHEVDGRWIAFHNYRRYQWASL